MGLLPDPAKPIAEPGEVQPGGSAAHGPKVRPASLEVEAKGVQVDRIADPGEADGAQGVIEELPHVGEEARLGLVHVDRRIGDLVLALGGGCPGIDEPAALNGSQVVKGHIEGSLQGG